MLNAYAQARIEDQFSYYQQGLVTKDEAIRQITKIASFEIEIAEGMGYNQGYWDAAAKHLVHKLPVMPEPTKKQRQSGIGKTVLVDLPYEYEQSDSWRRMRANEDRMVRRENAS